MKSSIKTTLVALCAAGSALLISGCDNDGSDNNGVKRYEITVTNATNNQPMSPAALIIHANGYTGWQTGNPASDGLELLAESGDASDFAAEAESNASALTQLVADGMLFPGQTETYTLMVTQADERASTGGGTEFTLATMPVNTNDAFVGLTAIDIAGLESGDERVLFARIYDAGTEENLETAATIPGPAGGGEAPPLLFINLTT